jgi:DNA-binding PadR family transcriptional regulator
VFPLRSESSIGSHRLGVCPTSSERKRRIYSLTPAGREELERLKEVMRPKLEEAIRTLRDLYEDLGID